MDSRPHNHRPGQSTRADAREPPPTPSSRDPTSRDRAPEPRQTRRHVAEARAGTVRREIVRNGIRRLRQQAQRNGEHLRALRQRANVSQAAVARAIGVHRSVISRLESGDPSVGLAIRCMAAELLGAEISLTAYTIDSPRIHDRAHARLVERLVRSAHSAWRIQPEAPVLGPVRRSVDLRLDGETDIVLFEVESRFSRVEEIMRECRAKADAVAATAGGRRVHVVLVLPRTRHNRAVVAAARETLRHAFPVESTELLAALTGGGPWPGSGILWLGTRE
jgi:transcriptional regulator with XRE-family HTH domain